MSCVPSKRKKCEGNSNVPSTRRTNQDIIMDILKIAKKGERKTKIMYDANLSFTQIEKYLAILDNAGLIAKEESFWRTTEKGVNVMESCKTCQLLMKQIQQQQIE